ncbi:MAG: hypothetical protein GPI96_04870 [Microcystis aeruginosa BS13-02]|nr:hypothetical protein [Microcystis aeruginosa BS13-02]
MAIATSPKQYPLILPATLALTVLQGNPNLDGDGISAFTINNSGQIAMADSDDKAVVISLT